MANYRPICLFSTNNQFQLRQNTLSSNGLTDEILQEITSTKLRHTLPPEALHEKKLLYIKNRFIKVLADNYDLQRFSFREKERKQNEGAC